MDSAKDVSDRITFMDHGVILVNNSPENLSINTTIKDLDNFKKYNKNEAIASFFKSK